MRAALVCDVSFPVNTQNGNDENRNMKRIPLPYTKPFDIQESHEALHAAIPKGKKYVIDVLMRMLSQHGDFTDYYSRFPEDWDRLEEMRGR